MAMITSPEFLCCLGLIAHQLSILAEMSQADGKMITPLAYIKRRPYKFSLSVIGAIVGYVVLLQLGELTPITAFGVGYIANDSIDRVGKITAVKMQ